MPLAGRTFLYFGLIVTALLVIPAASSFAAANSRLIVVLDSSARFSAVENSVKAEGGRIKQRLPAAHALVVVPRDKIGAGLLLRRLKSLAGVRYVETDYPIRQTVEPNDPMFSNQYQHFQENDHDIDSTAAWDQKTSCSKVAVLDSGVQTDHPDLEGKIWKNSKETPGNDRDDDKNGYIDDYYGVDLRDDTGSGGDNNGHGTHVAGIIGARGNNGKGLAGICWSATIMPLKFLGANGQGFTSDGIKGIDYAISKGAKIINCSFGSDDKSAAFEEAIVRAKESGVLLVVASGNDGQNIDQRPTYPASFTETNILTVGASNIDDDLATYSNYGKTSVDLLAPGDEILSTYLDSSYKRLSGTSMATPMVSGVAAMLRAKDSDATYSEIRKAVRTSVDKISAANGKTYSGGRLNDLGALNKL